jgi:hypothetical protein
MMPPAEFQLTGFLTQQFNIKAVAYICKRRHQTIYSGPRLVAQPFGALGYIRVLPFSHVALLFSAVTTKTETASTLHVLLLPNDLILGGDLQCIAD